jgi:uncharacterized RDD family membrane protein YckC
MNVEVNYLAVLLAGLISMPLGFVWYMPKVFGNTWMKGAGLKAKDLEGGPLPYILSFVASLVTAYVLAHVAYLSNSFFKHSFLQDTLTTAFWLWLGFTGARLTVHMLYERKTVIHHVITHGYELITIMAMGLIIGLLH